MAKNVQLRLAGVVELHASDGRCHNRCHAMFNSPRNNKCAIQRATSSKTVHFQEILPFLKLTKELSSQKSHIWTKSQILHIYKLLGGEKLFKYKIISSLLVYFDGDLIALQATGYSSIYIFKEYAKQINMYRNNEESLDFSAISKKIKSGISQV